MKKLIESVKLKTNQNIVNMNNPELKRIKEIEKEILSKVDEDQIYHGDIDLSGLCLKELPDLSNIIVYGSFDCSRNQLESLKGCPRMIVGDFICSNNKLKTFDYGPSFINGFYDCSFNELDNTKPLIYYSSSKAFYGFGNKEKIKPEKRNFLQYFSYQNKEDEQKYVYED